MTNYLKVAGYKFVGCNILYLTTKLHVNRLGEDHTMTTVTDNEWPGSETRQTERQAVIDRCDLSLVLNL